MRSNSTLVGLSRPFLSVRSSFWPFSYSLTWSNRISWQLLGQGGLLMAVFTARRFFYLRYVARPMSVNVASLLMVELIISRLRPNTTGSFEASKFD
jgi:hypothetical protein